MFRMSGFRCIRPFGLRGIRPSIHPPVSPAPSKIPYGGFSPVRLQMSLTDQPSLPYRRATYMALTSTASSLTLLGPGSPER